MCLNSFGHFANEPVSQPHNDALEQSYETESDYKNGCNGLLPIIVSSGVKTKLWFLV